MMIIIIRTSCKISTQESQHINLDLEKWNAVNKNKTTYAKWMWKQQQLYGHMNLLQNMICDR